MSKSFKTLTMSVAISLASIGAFAADANNTNPPPPPKDPARKEAHKECEATAKGDHKAMRACMEQKGFQPPPHPRHHPAANNAPPLPGQDQPNGAPPSIAPKGQ